MEVSKELSYILRHHPETYQLEMDDEGYVLISELLNKMHHKITEEDLYEIVKNDSKGRYLINDHKICALYGHSMKRKIIKKEGCPPDVLYHGTAKRFLASIFENGLLSMKRQYVHLSTDEKTAMEVGERRDKKPVLLVIDAKRAYQEGVKFYLGNKTTWLCDYLPSQYISKEE